jgi:hypothetical protein
VLRVQIHAIFLGIFAVAGLSHDTIMEQKSSLRGMQERTKGTSDMFLNGMLAKD